MFEEVLRFQMICLFPFSPGQGGFISITNSPRPIVVVPDLGVRQQRRSTKTYYKIFVKVTLSSYYI